MSCTFLGATLKEAISILICKFLHSCYINIYIHTYTHTHISAEYSLCLWYWIHNSLKSEEAQFLTSTHFLFLILLFYWWKIALQRCVGFCRTTRWISHKYIYIYLLSLLHLPPLPPSLSSRSSHRTRLGSLCYTSTSYQLSILHVIVYICQCCFLNLSHPHLCPQVCSLLGSSVPFF